MYEKMVELEFDWNSKNEWKEYLKEIGNLYRAMDRYVRLVAHIRSLNGTSAGYAREKNALFYNDISEPFWTEFLRYFYEVKVDNERIGWEGGPFETIEDYGIEYEWAPGIHGTLVRAHKLLTQAGFKAGDMIGQPLREPEDFVDIAEELIRSIVSLFSLVNEKTFFILSLRYLPEGYARRMYGDLESVKEIMGWNRITEWMELPMASQIHTITEPRWRNIADSLQLLFGYSGTARDVNSTWEMWNRIEKYTGINPHTEYLAESLKSLGRAYKEKPKLYDSMNGDYWLPGGDVVEGEVALKSLRDFGVKYWNVIDELDQPKAEMQYDSLIRFAAPQMFLNIATMYINVDGDWVIGLYLPKSFMRKEVRIEHDDFESGVHVCPPRMPRNVLLPDEWEMYGLRDFLQEERCHRELVTTQVAEWEDYSEDNAEK